MISTSVRDWIRHRELHGFTTFSFEDVEKNFHERGVSILRTELSRIIRKRIIHSPYRGFYVIIPPQYALKGIVPPVYYVDQLLAYLHKPYYIGLLNAAELHGAGHQRSQKCSVVTILPKSSVSGSKNKYIEWLYKAQLPSRFLETRNSETGTITFSSPELTAIDLIQYDHYIGGLSRAATVLSELSERIDFSDIDTELFDFVSLSAVQRLGYILERILEETNLAESLHSKLFAYGKRLNYVPLSTRHPLAPDVERDSKWKIKINNEIEIDDL